MSVSKPSNSNSIAETLRTSDGRFKTGRPRVALVGVSGYASVHLTELLRLRDAGQIEFTACVVIDASDHAELVRSLAAGGCAIYGDFDSMVSAHAGKLDLCCLPTPIPLHAPMSLAALSAGANVLLEKPLTATLTDAEAIIAAEQCLGRFVAIGYQDLYQAETLELKRSLLKGVLGPIREIRVLGVRSRPLSYYRRNNWAGRTSNAGIPIFDSPVNNAFAHFVNLALYFAGADPAGSARPLQVRARLFRAQPIENFDTALLKVETDTGPDIKIYTTHSCKTDLPAQILIVGDKGTAEWTSGANICIKTFGGTQESPLPSPVESRRRMFNRVIARLQDPASPICTSLSAKEHVRLVNLIQTSPILDVSPEWIERTPSGSSGDEQIAITGIECVFHRAFVDGTDIQDVDFPGTPTKP